MQSRLNFFPGTQRQVFHGPLAWSNLVQENALCLYLSLWPPRLAPLDGSLSSASVSHINSKPIPKNTPNYSERKGTAIVGSYILTQRCHLYKMWLCQWLMFWKFCLVRKHGKDLSKCQLLESISHLMHETPALVIVKKQNMNMTYFQQKWLIFLWLTTACLTKSIWDIQCVYIYIYKYPKCSLLSLKHQQMTHHLFCLLTRLSIQPLIS